MKVALSMAALWFALAAYAPLQAVSLPECTDDSVDAGDIIVSAPCGLYGVALTRQENGSGAELDVSVQYMVHVPVGAPKALVVLFPVAPAAPASSPTA